MYRRVSRWMDGWMDGWVGGWMDGPYESGEVFGQSKRRKSPLPLLSLCCQKRKHTGVLLEFALDTLE